jgi:hypothetical protein
VRRRTGPWLALPLALPLALLLAACLRPVHARTYALHVDGHSGYDHPARVGEGQLDLALRGRVADADLPGLAPAMARAFARLGPDQVLYYRHPDGGAWLFGVRGGKLVVTPFGARAAVARPAEYALADLAEADRPAAPPKKLVHVERVTTGHADAELEVEVAFAIEQYVFVGGTFVGTVGPGQTRVFRVPAGRARVVVADGKDGATNAAGVELDLEVGVLERLSVEPQL